MRRALSWFALTGLAVCISMTTAAQSPCGCEPQQRAGYSVNSVLTVSVSGLSGSDLDALRRGLNYWNGYFAATNQEDQRYLEYVTGTDGDIKISVDETLSNVALSNHNPDGTGTIRLPPSVRNNQPFLQTITSHETGHNLGFMNRDEGSCSGRTVMYRTIDVNNGPFITEMMPCDNNALLAVYPSPSSGSTDWCANGGCTPGYEPMGSSGCSEATEDECGCCLTYSPIVLDLNADGVRFSSAEQGVRFYINDMGRRYQLGWPVDSDDVWLWMDRNGNGVVDSGAELFGNATRLASGRPAENGFVALAELDTNGNGAIEANDTGYAVLTTWADVNRNGMSEPTEVQSLADHGVITISLAYRESRRTDQFGNVFRFRAPLELSGSARRVWAYDVYPVHLAVDGPAEAATCSAAGTAN